METSHFTPNCAHCTNEISTDDHCFKTESDEFYHRECYHEAHTHDCEYCLEDINTNIHTVIPTKHGNYHRECFYKDQSDTHCNQCTEPLVTGQNQHKTTNDDNTIYLCTDCYSLDNTEDAKDVVAEFDSDLNHAAGPTQKEQQQLGLHDTPHGWEQADRE